MKAKVPFYLIGHGGKESMKIKSLLESDVISGLDAGVAQDLVTNPQQQCSFWRKFDSSEIWALITFELCELQMFTRVTTATSLSRSQVELKEFKKRQVLAALHRFLSLQGRRRDRVSQSEVWSAWLGWMMHESCSNLTLGMHVLCIWVALCLHKSACMSACEYAKGTVHAVPMGRPECYTWTAVT